MAQDNDLSKVQGGTDQMQRELDSLTEQKETLLEDNLCLGTSLAGLQEETSQVKVRFASMIDCFQTYIEQAEASFESQSQLAERQHCAHSQSQSEQLQQLEEEV